MTLQLLSPGAVGARIGPGYFVRFNETVTHPVTPTAQWDIQVIWNFSTTVIHDVVPWSGQQLNWYLGAPSSSNHASLHIGGSSEAAAGDSVDLSILVFDTPNGWSDSYRETFVWHPTDFLYQLLGLPVQATVDLSAVLAAVTKNYQNAV